MTGSLAVKSLGYRYPGGYGFSDVSFSASAGEVTCIFGLNGSGKTTLFRVLSTLVAPGSGEYFVCGMNASLNRGAVRRKIFPVFDSNAHFDDLTGRENIGLFLSLYDLPVPDSADNIAAVFDLDLDRRVREYSLGMKRKLSLTESFLSGREILYFDEPTLGLDSSMRSAFFSMVSDAAKRASCVVFCSNRIEDAGYADHLWKMEKGTLAPAGSPDELVRGMLRVTVSFAEHEIIEHIQSAEELPEIIRKMLSVGTPRKITVSGGEDEGLWTDEARQKIAKAPRVLQHMITTLVERHAQESGCARITADVVDEVRMRFERR